MQNIIQWNKASQPLGNLNVDIIIWWHFRSSALLLKPFQAERVISVWPKVNLWKFGLLQISILQSAQSLILHFTVTVLKTMERMTENVKILKIYLFNAQRFCVRKTRTVLESKEIGLYWMTFVSFYHLIVLFDWCLPQWSGRGWGRWGIAAWSPQQSWMWRRCWSRPWSTFPKTHRHSTIPHPACVLLSPLGRSILSWATRMRRCPGRSHRSCNALLQRLCSENCLSLCWDFLDIVPL